MDRKSLIHMMFLSISCVVVFYFLPIFFFAVLKNSADTLALLFQLVVNPIFALFSSFFYSLFHRFRHYGLVYCGILTLLFLPAVPMFYAAPGYALLPIYLALALIGGFVANVLRTNREEKK